MKNYVPSKSTYPDTKTFLLSFLFPQTVVEVASAVNGKIRIEYYRGCYRSSVGGYWQSGEYAKKILNSALENIKNHLSSPTRSGIHLMDSRFRGNDKIKILILGLGCGSMAQVLSGHFHHAEIVGVDIDKTIVDLGRKYFGLGKIKNIKVVIADAYEYLKSISGFPKTRKRMGDASPSIALRVNEQFAPSGAQPSQEGMTRIRIRRNSYRFDLIISDLFIGCQTPVKFDSDKFVEMTYAHLALNGVYISNRSYIKEYQKASDKFLEKIKRKFSQVFPIYKSPNLIIAAEK